MGALKQFFSVLFVLFAFQFPNPAGAQDIDELLKTSIEYSNKGAYQQALNLINRAIQYDSARADLFLQRATIQYFLGHYDNTIRDCYTTLRLKPNVPEVYLLRGKVCIVTESYGGAILFFGKALKYTSDNDLLYEAYLNRGKAYFSLQRFQDAFSDFQAAYKINNKSIDILFPLADTYLQINRPCEALSTLNRVIIVNPDYAPAYELLGRIAIENKDYPEAIKAYEKYTTLNPNTPSAFNDLAEVYRLDKQYERALSTLNHSISIDPMEPATYKIKGLVYIDLGETEKGCNSLFRSMQLGYFEKYGYDLLDIYTSNCEK
jgi:tetratricopeptide (TPR) repeat protein